MELLFIIALVILLYVRTLNYNYIIDDNVKRQGYMYEVPLISPAPDFFDTKPSKIYRLFMLAMHCVNVSIVSFIWGWQSALLFAVHPACVWGTAWVTGNYYATTAFFALMAFWILHVFPNAWGALAAMPFYVSALNSTVCAINLPFLFLFTGTPWGLALLGPLAWYLRGKKFTTGIAIRKKFVTGKKVKREFKISRLILMTKVVAKYLFTSICPDKLGLFGGWGNELMDNPKAYKKMHSMDKEFWLSVALIVAVAAVGFHFSPLGTFWFFVIISLHSQFNIMGQFYAERYLYLPIVGVCIIAGTALASHPVALAVVATILVVRTHLFIPTFKNQGTLFRNDVDTYPEFGEVYSNLAQYYMNRKPLPAWRINEVAMMLFKGDLLTPNSWKTQMNIACFFAITNQWHPCLAHTNIAIKILEGIGGEITPLTQLYKQRDDIAALLKPAPGAPVSPGPKKVGTDEGTRNAEGAAVVESNRN